MNYYTLWSIKHCSKVFAIIFEDLADFDNFWTTLTRNELCTSEIPNFLHKSIEIPTYNFDEKFIGLGNLQNVCLQHRYRLTVDVATDQ